MNLRAVLPPQRGVYYFWGGDIIMSITKEKILADANKLIAAKRRERELRAKFEQSLLEFKELSYVLCDCPAGMALFDVLSENVSELVERDIDYILVVLEHEAECMLIYSCDVMDDA
jgi:septum formation inhibitor-activating ATPase MinD